ncbi:MAG: Ig-like domain-containing protein [Firmicutes bacterium]|nr:Ig-like domain-containing protein [Candidatus Colivicinus equi]
MVKKLIVCLVTILFATCIISCKAHNYYLYKEYLNTLAVKSGISDSVNIEENIDKLLAWQIIGKSDYDILDDELNYELLSKTITNLIDNDENEEISKCYWANKEPQEKVEKEIADEIIEKAVNYINNRTYEHSYSSTYKKEVKKNIDDVKIGDIYYDQTNNEYKKLLDISNDEYIFEEAEYEDVFDSLEFANTFEIDFEQSEVIPSGDFEKSNYVNNRFDLLSTKAHSFNTDGFRISYTLNASNISVHISKKLNSLNFYTDLSLSNIKPTFKWTYDDDNVKHAYFRVNFNSTEKVGVSIGKYNNYYLNFKDLDSKSFLNKLKNTVNRSEDELEAIIPICTIKTPIPELPSVELDLEVLVKIYTSGKAELQLYNSHSLGFETKNGEFRIINDAKRDFDFIASGSSKAIVGLNFALEAAKLKLADIEFDGGLKAELKPTIHLYDAQGNVSHEQSDLAYSTINNIAKENTDVAVCADASFRWVFDIVFNTSKTKLYKLGFTKTLSILDDDAQVLNNMHHIENGIFVEKCTRNNRTNSLLTTTIYYKKITLASYAEVISKDEDFQIRVLGVPEGYTIDGLKYNSEDNDIASVNSSGVVSGHKPGSVKIKITTDDSKYNAYVNILVSSE